VQRFLLDLFFIICDKVRILMGLMRLHLTIMDILSSRYLKIVKAYVFICDVYKMKTTMFTS
jgi:hypothetical protein